MVFQSSMETTDTESELISLSEHNFKKTTEST